MKNFLKLNLPCNFNEFGITVSVLAVLCTPGLIIHGGEAIYKNQKMHKLAVNALDQLEAYIAEKKDNEKEYRELVAKWFRSQELIQVMANTINLYNSGKLEDGCPQQIYAFDRDELESLKSFLKAVEGHRFAEWSHNFNRFGELDVDAGWRLAFDIGSDGYVTNTRLHHEEVRLSDNMHLPATPAGGVAISRTSCELLAG